MGRIFQDFPIPAVKLEVISPKVIMTGSRAHLQLIHTDRRILRVLSKNSTLADLEVESEINYYFKNEEIWIPRRIIVFQRKKPKQNPIRPTKAHWQV